MRAARVPAPIAVTAHGVHFIISTVNSSESFQAFQRERGQQREGLTAPTLSTSSAKALPSFPFRLSALLPADWSALLRMCRQLTHPDAAFTFSSPGDGVVDVSVENEGGNESGASSSSAAASTANLAFLHVVERVADDFTPNNMIYHELQRYPNDFVTPAAASSSTGLASADSHGERPSSPSFAAFIANLQQQPAQSAEEAEMELMTLADTACAAATAEQKRKRDPLFTRVEVQVKSAENVQQLQRYIEACALHGADSIPNDAYRFSFFPFTVCPAVSMPYCTAHFCVLVNLKPIVPYHLMVVPIRCVGTIHGLTEEEVADWGRVMRCTVDVLEELRRRPSDSTEHACPAPLAQPPCRGNYSIAIQQGALAGQTVNHLHVHVIPFDPRGKLAGEPETDETEQRRRPPRTPLAMRTETETLRPLFATCAAAASVVAAEVAPLHHLHCHWASEGAR